MAMAPAKVEAITVKLVNRLGLVVDSIQYSLNPYWTL
jgi:hypothetical protein